MLGAQAFFFNAPAHGLQAFWSNGIQSLLQRRLQRLGWRQPEAIDLAYLLIALISVGSLAGAAWAWWDRHRRDPWQRLGARVARRLDALDVDAAEHEGPRRWAERVRKRLGPAGEALATQLDGLDAMRYGRDASARPQAAWWRSFDATAAAVRSASR